MVDFCLCHLDSNRYHELLKRDFKPNKYHYTLSKLTGSYSFESARKLFEHLKLEDLSPEGYSTSMFGTLDSILYVPDDNFVKSGSDMLTSMWNHPSFEAHRKHFLNNLSIGYASKNKIVSLIKRNMDIKVLPKIITSLNQEQRHSIMEEDRLIYEMFTRIRNRQLDIGAGDSQSPDSLLDIDTLQQEGTDVRSKV